MVSQTTRLGSKFERIVGASQHDADRYVMGIQITSAQLLALHSTPVAVLAAPGAGRALVIEEIRADLDFNSAAYAGIAGGEDLEFRYTNATGTQIAELETTGFLDATADRVQYAWGDNRITLTANAAVVVRLVGAITTGNSPVNLTITYRIVDA